MQDGVLDEFAGPMLGLIDKHPHNVTDQVRARLRDGVQEHGLLQTCTLELLADHIKIIRLAEDFSGHAGAPFE